MSQHDFNIANQSFPATRTDLNNALQALASNSSGDAEPSTTFANQWWYETDTNTLKLRNEANNAWLSFATVDQSTAAWTLAHDVIFGDNDKAIFGAGSDLQIYHDPAAGSIIQEGGSGSLFIRASTNIQLEGVNGENMAIFNENGSVQLYYDNAEKLATTATGIDVTGTVVADGLTVSQGSGANILLESTTTGATTGDIFGEIEFKTNDSSSPGIKGKIDSYSEGAVGNGALRLFTGDTTGLYQRMNIASNGDISFYEDTGTTAKFFWDASAESLGIGTSSPDRALHVTRGDGTGTVVKVGNTGSSAATIEFANTGSTDTVSIGAENNDLVLKSDDGNISLNATGDPATASLYVQRGGNVGIGTTTTTFIGATFKHAISGNQFMTVMNTTLSAADMIDFVTTSGLAGKISVSGSTTTYATSSDYRLKTDAQPMTGASARVQALKPVNFEWISSGERVDGFLAHEAQAIVPECVTGTKDAVDADGNPDYQGIDQSKLVPLLTAALQEALTKIADMETRLSALEG
jgi:hypothetical protein